MMSRRAAQGGFTLIELMVVVAVLGLLAMLVAPSFRDMILMQRLRGINSQVTTDMQFARSEAVSRGRIARVVLGSDANQTCYVIYTARDGGVRCDCTLGAGSACPVGAGWTEVRTVSVPRSSGVALDWPIGQTTFGYDHITGGLVSIPSDDSIAPLVSVQIDARIDDDRRLRNRILQTGRPSVCAPNPARMQVTTC
jgi:type IV fimbrial biogenesis protein FimT